MYKNHFYLIRDMFFWPIPPKSQSLYFSQFLLFKDPLNSFRATYPMGFWPVPFLEHNTCYSTMTTPTKKMQLFHEISITKWLSFPMIYNTIYFRFLYCVKFDNQILSASKKSPIYRCMAQLGPFLLPIYRCMAQKELK